VTDLAVEVLGEGDTIVLVHGSGLRDATWPPCDVLEEHLRAERAVLPGKGHGAQHAPGFNERLLAFWKSCGC
jgi:hypothetical protein